MLVNFNYKSCVRYKNEIEVLICTRCRETGGEWITSESIVAETNGTVIDNPAVGVYSARVGTRVDALLVHASSSQRALGADHALGSAIWWPADVRGEARADCLVVVHATFAVWSAG